MTSYSNNLVCPDCGQPMRPCDDSFICADCEDKFANNINSYRQLDRDARLKKATFNPLYQKNVDLNILDARNFNSARAANDYLDAMLDLGFMVKRYDMGSVIVVKVFESNQL